MDTLDAIARLLPEDRRERFYALMARLRTVPEDDEYLLILEAIGFMTLVWREVPEQVRQAIASSSPPHHSTDSSCFLVEEVRKCVKQALDVPTYSDMRQLAAKWDEQHNLFKTAVTRLTNQHAPSSPESYFRKGRPSAVILGVFVGIIIGVILSYFVIPIGLSELSRDLNAQKDSHQLRP